MILYSIRRTCFVLLFCCLFLSPPIAGAHEPHDDIFSLQISPTYSQDKTLFINVRRVLFKSTDGGQNWVRLVKGLDNKGFLQSLAISSQTKDILYVSSLEDGVYRSEDAGISWTKVNNGLKNLSIELLAVSPRSADIVFACGKSGGLYKTSDGGENWHEVIAEDKKVTAIDFSPGSMSKIVIGTNKGVLYLSDDMGETWEERFAFQNSGALTALAYSPNFSQDSTFFAGTEKSGIFKSADAGVSFKEINSGLSDQQIADIKFITNSRIIASAWNEGVFCSNDAGATWKRCSNGLTRDFQAEHPEWIKEKGLVQMRPHFSFIGVSDGCEKDKTVFLAGYNGLFKSTSAGYSWKELETYPASLIVGIALSPDYKNDATVCAATYTRGAFVSNDGGLNWEYFGREFRYVRHQLQAFLKGPAEDRITLLWGRVFDVVFAPDKSLYFTLLWAGRFNFLKYQNGQGVRNFTSGATGGIALSPNYAKDKTIYLASQAGNIFISNDAGKNFKKIGKIKESQAHESITFLLSPDFETDRTMYFSDGEGVYQSIDAGLSWRLISNDNLLAGRSQISLAISPDYKNDKTLIAGTDNGVYMTEDAGKTWSVVSDTPEIKEGFAEAVAISPVYKNDKTFLAGIRGKGLFKTQDGGRIFTHIGDDSISLSRVNCPSASMPIQFSPDYAQDKTIFGYGAAGCQIYKSADGGSSWQVISLPRPKDTFADFIVGRMLILKELSAPLRAKIINMIKSKRFWAVVIFAIAVLSYFIWLRKKGKIHS